MLLLADMFGLKYWMIKEESVFNHTVLVEEVTTGKSAEFCLETLQLLKSDLSPMALIRVKNDLRTFRKDFLEYWDECRATTTTM